MTSLPGSASVSLHVRKRRSRCRQLSGRRDALELAQALLARDGRVTLVYVEILQGESHSDSGTGSDAERQRFGLERLRRLRGEAGVSAEIARIDAPSVRHGLYDFACQRGADLIVIRASEEPRPGPRSAWQRRARSVGKPSLRRSRRSARILSRCGSDAGDRGPRTTRHRQATRHLPSPARSRLTDMPRCRRSRSSDRRSTPATSGTWTRRSTGMSERRLSGSPPSAAWPRSRTSSTTP